MKVVNYSELRPNFKRCLDQVAEDARELIITRRDQKDMVLIPLGEYRALKETQHLLSGPNGKRLRASVEAVRKGDMQQKGCWKNDPCLDPSGLGRSPLLANNG